MSEEQKTYIVQIPITGYVSFEVEAEDEESAKEAAWQQADNNDAVEDGLVWEYRERMTTGWVTHAILNEIEVEEV